MVQHYCTINTWANPYIIPGVNDHGRVRVQPYGSTVGSNSSGGAAGTGERGREALALALALAQGTGEGVLRSPHSLSRERDPSLESVRVQLLLLHD